jgi:excisionase family DNA binding protein
MTDELLTVREVAERLKVKPVTVQRWLRAGTLRGTLLSDRMGWRVPAAEVDRLMGDAGQQPS